jgi:hypothetical protein
MTLQDFIPIWQAQPFRAFRMQTTRGEFVVTYPMAVALTPQLRVVLVSDDSHVETFALDDIAHCEAFGEPMSVAEALSAIPPEKLALHAQLISQAQAASLTDNVETPHVSDPGRVVTVSAQVDDGVQIVHATLETRDGTQMFSTAGTRWSLHGLEQFDNGASLFLHHLDHPTVEQRVILWPPDRGTFDSFAEAMSASALADELHRRDKELTAKPSKPVEPPAAYFRKIVGKWELADIDGRAEAFGADAAALDPARYEFVLVPRVTDSGREVRNPCLTDIMKEEILFHLVDTDWDATGQRVERTWHISLRHPSSVGHETTLHVDGDRRGATIDADTRLLPLAWIERHLRNFVLYESWGAMYQTLRAGPVQQKRPDVLIPLEGGFRAELWAGEPRYSLPFLQPHILDAAGRTVFDLRSTTWAAAIHADKKRPGITLLFSTGERGTHDSADPYPLELDLVTHRVTCPNLEGSTTIGMLQSMVRHARGMPWLLEEIPKWFEKGRLVR